MSSNNRLVLLMLLQCNMSNVTVSYCVRLDKCQSVGLTIWESFGTHLENYIGSKSHQTTQPSGCCRKVSSGVTRNCTPSGVLPTRSKANPTHSTNDTGNLRNAVHNRVNWRGYGLVVLLPARPKPLEFHSFGQSTLRPGGALKWL